MFLPNNNLKIAASLRGRGQTSSDIRPIYIYGKWEYNSSTLQELTHVERPKVAVNSLAIMYHV